MLNHFKIENLVLYVIKRVLVCFYLQLYILFYLFICFFGFVLYLFSNFITVLGLVKFYPLSVAESSSCINDCATCPSQFPYPAKVYDPD